MRLARVVSMAEALLLSIRPRFARLLFDGSKTVELRRKTPNVQAGMIVLVYESSPTMALVGSGTIKSVEVGSPDVMWATAEDQAGLSRLEYDKYFEGCGQATFLGLTNLLRFTQPVTLSDMRERWPWLQPPQSYRYVSATVVDRALKYLAQR